MTLVRRSIAALTVAATSLGVSAQPAETILRINVTPVSEIEPAQKDRAVYDAFLMLGERLEELPMELGNDDDARPFIRLGWHALLGRTAVYVTTAPAPPGVGVALSLSPRAPLTAGELVDTIGARLLEEGAPAQVGEGSIMVPSPFGPVMVRAQDGQARLNFNLADPAPTDVRTLGLPDGASMIASGEMNMNVLSKVIEPMIAAQDPMVAEQLRGAGMIGPGAPSIDFAIGTTRNHLHFVQRVRNARAYMASNGLDVDYEVTDETLSVVPVGATRVAAFGLNLKPVIDRIMGQFEQLGGPDPFEMVREQTGIDLREAVFKNIGPGIVYYQSMETGGGGALSGVLIADLRDARAFGDAHARSVELVNALARDAANGYVRVRAWKIDGRDAFTLTLPGLPIPLELSWTVFNGRFVAAASPGALGAALDQIARPRSSVVGNEAFQEATGPIMPDAGVSTLYFSDTAFFAQRGYGFVSLLTSGLANAVRSPQDEGRQVGMLMPSFSAFITGIEPAGGVSVLEGDVLRSVYRGDRSVLVHAAELADSAGGLAGVSAAGAGVGVMLPALQKAREQARMVKSSAQARNMVQAMMVYADDHRDMGPANFDELVDGGYLPNEFLLSPLGPAEDGGPDYAMRRNAEMSFDADAIMVVDRAAWVNGSDRIPVAFADVRVEQMWRWELEEAFLKPENEGLVKAFDLQIDPFDW